MKSGKGWKSTRLWTELAGREGETPEQLKLILARALPEAEKVLSSGGSPANFTLHDADHSLRVAERMADIAGKDLLVQLGPHDLALLLLSAYLHDIGMTPPLSKVDGHYDYLLTGNGDLLDADERDALQAWLDDEWNGQVPPSSPPLRRAAISARHGRSSPAT